MSENPTREDIIVELQEAEESYGRPINTLDEFEFMTDYSKEDLFSVFDTWSDAQDAAGYEVSNAASIPTEKLLDEVRRVADELGKTPTSKDMEDHGRYSYSTYNARFDSWCEVVNEAGLDAGNIRRSPDKEELIEDIQHVGDKIGEQPTANDMTEHGEFSVGVYIRKFGSWNEALEAAGYEPITQISEEELMDEIRRLDDLVEGRPTTTDMREEGKYAPRLYTDRFGSWANVVEELGYDPDKHPRRISREDMLDAIRDVAEELGKAPNTSEFDEHGEFTCSAIYREFESWSDAITEAGVSDKETA